MDEISLRKQAIVMHLSNHSPTEICRSLNKSRPWFYKWLNRYKQNSGGDWFIEQSRRPHHIYERIPQELETLIVQIRQKLQETTYAQIGAISIQWELQKLNIEPPPIWTIDRIISRHGLARKNPPPAKKQNEYPDYSKAYTHELDIVGPRYLKNAGKFYFCNLIDTNTHCVHINPIINKSAEAITRAVIRFWQQFGIPDFLQMDNELSFRGSNRYPHSFGTLIRFALSQSVIPIFIPQAEPWRNGIIEKFNDTFDKKFFRTQTFKDYNELLIQSQRFEAFHNQNYRYSAHQNRTPNDMHQLNGPVCYLKSDHKLPEHLTLKNGDIILVRFIRSDRKLNIFGETFPVKPSLIYHYVKAVICIDAQQIKIYLDNKLVQDFPYYVPLD